MATTTENKTEAPKQPEDVVQAQLETLKKLFAEADADKNGSLNPREIHAVYTKLGFKFNEVQAQFITKIADANADGQLQFDEFCHLYGFLADINGLFAETDENKDGNIQTNELDKCMNKLGFKFSDKQIKFMYKMADADGNGTIDREEFATLLLFVHYCEKLYAIADENGDNKVSVAELKKFLPHLGIPSSRKDIDDIFKEFDEDHSGDLQFEEFVSVVMKLLFTDNDVVAKEMDKLVALFKELDTDKSGQLSPAELQKGYEKFGFKFNQKQADFISKIADANSSGEVDFEEFCHLYGFLMDVKNIFAQFDTNKDNVIQTEELEKCLHDLLFHFSTEQVKYMYKMVDANHDGKVDYEEFTTLLLFIHLSEKLFAIADTDGSNSVSIEELKKFLPFLGVKATDEEISTAFTKFDEDKSGSLQFEEFIALLMSLTFK